MKTHVFFASAPDETAHISLPALDPSSRRFNTIAFQPFDSCVGAAIKVPAARCSHKATNGRLSEAAHSIHMSDGVKDAAFARVL